ncbi:hypothetical protein GCM10022212_21600 [Actimicrobium antarcticum]|uniref:NEL domain-containing protein n=2 Tax=Actimicrobium antarcticum TaxID=1051899 RepID=A0ABP7TBE3_9BURK
MQQNLAGVSALLDNGVAVNAFNTNTTRAISNYAATPETAAATMNHPHWSWSHADQATPLHLAVAFAADPELMRTLIRRGANVNARPGNGITALHWAAAFSDSPMVINTLIECGAAINAESHRQETPLQLASMSQYPLVSMALIAAGANLEARNENQMTALHYAAATSSEPAMLRTLIELGSDLEARAEAQMTPLHLAAASSNEPAMLRTLIALGSDLNSIDDNGRTPLDCAREREEPDIFVNLLLQAGAASGAVLRAAQATQVALAIDLDADFAFALQLHENDLAQIQRNNYAGTSREVADDIDNAQQTSTTQAGPNTSSSGVPVASTTARLSPSESSPTSNVNARRQQLASQLPLFLSDSLVRRVEIWYGSENQTQVPERASDWYATRNDEHATEFGEFLAALSETAEFRQPALQPALQQRMQRLLDAMQTYPELRTQCFALAHDSTSSCGDRVTLALNTMEMARINHHAELGMYTTNDLIELRTGMFRLDVLAQVAREKIAALQAASGGRDVEEIEVVLGFQTLLASHFKLPAVAQAMRYRYSSGITDADLENAKEKVTTREGRDEYIQFIATWKPWQQNLERTRPEVFDALRHQVETEREPLAVQPAFTSEHDYMAMCSELERMQTARQVIAVNRLTRQLVVQYRDQQSA